MSRIAIDITQAQYQGTGVGNYTKQLVENLLTIDQENEYVLFATSVGNWSYLRSFAKKFNGSPRIWPIPPRLGEWLFNVNRKTPIELFTGPIDLLHASDWTLPPTRAAKVVTTVHDLSPIVYPKYHHPKTIQVFTRHLQLVEKEADYVIADSNATKSDLLKYSAILPEKVAVVHLAASNDFVEFCKLERPEKLKLLQQFKEKYNLSDNYILSVGTNEPRKNLRRTIEAFQQFNSTIVKPMQLVVVGKYGWGDYEPAKSKDDNVIFLGLLPQKELPLAYLGAKVFVYASMYEGFGLPVLEAMTLGKPVVTTNKGSLKEVAGDAAVLVNPYSVSSIASGLAKALSLKSKLSTESKTQANKFSYTKTAEKTLEIYRSLLR